MGGVDWRESPEGALRPSRRAYPERARHVSITVEGEKGYRLPLYDRVVATFGEPGLVELIAVIRYYTSVSTTINAFEIETPGINEQPFGAD